MLGRQECTAFTKSAEDPVLGDREVQPVWQGVRQEFKVHGASGGKE
jgi:hypothetical protein